MTEAFYRLTAPNYDLKSAALAIGYLSGTPTPIVARWFAPDAWILESGVLVETSAQTVASGVGFCAGFNDSASGAYLLQYSGGLVHLNVSGIATAYPASSGIIFTGSCLCSGQPYSLDGLGNLYAATSYSVIPNAFGSTPSRDLVASGVTLYTLLPAVSGVGTFTLSSLTTGTSGFIASPFPLPECIAVSGHPAIGGSDYATIASGFSQMVFDPSSGDFLAGITPSTSGLRLWENDSVGDWSLVQSVSGIGNPTSFQWYPDALGGISVDPVSGIAAVLELSFSNLDLVQTISVTGASAVGFTADSLYALVASKASSEVTPLHYITSSWTAETAVPFANPGLIVPVSGSTTQMIVGTTDGLSVFNLNGTTWASGQVISLPFTPTSITTDAWGNIYAGGTAGGLGYYSYLTVSGLVNTYSFSGSVIGIAESQGRVVIADEVNNLLRVFGLINNVIVSGTTWAAPSGVASMSLSTSLNFPYLLASNSVSGWFYQFAGPYDLLRSKYGKAAIYTGSAWDVLNMGVGRTPSAITFDPSGNVSIVTHENYFYTMSNTGSLVSSGQVAQFSPQPQTTPLGLSCLLWVGNDLYSASILNDSLVQIV